QGEGQGRDRVVRDEGRASARCGDRDRPRRRCGARGHALRDAAARAVWPDSHLPRLVRHVQYPRGGRCPRKCLDQSAECVCMSEDTKTVAPEAGIRPDLEVTTPAGAPDDLGKLTDDIVAALKTVYDPEIPADIYELGLIYKIDIGDDRAVTVDMTLTT